MPVSNRRIVAEEEWRDVPNTLDLKVSNLGRALQRGVIITDPTRRFGTGGCSGQICHLVLLAFVGPCPNGMECCHWDDDPSNNVLSNLRWGTKEDNARDAIRNGKHVPVKGEDNGRAKLTASKVVLVRMLHETMPDVWKSQVLARVFGVTNAVIWHVLKRRTWRHVP